MYIDLTQPPLIIEIPDYEIAGNIISKRKAEFKAMLYDVRSNRVMVQFDEVPYENIDGKYGNEISTILIKRAPIEIFALNDTLINIETYSNICKASDEYIVQESTDEEGNTIPAVLNPLLEKVNYTLEFNFYNMMAKSQPVIIEQLIGQKILTYYTK